MDFTFIIKGLYQQIETLKKENVHLRQENNQLKERLGLNSTNSSLPPSRDLYRARKNRIRSRALKMRFQEKSEYEETVWGERVIKVVKKVEMVEGLSS